MKFKLEIELGNEAMQDCSDVHDALQDVSRSVAEGLQSDNIRDINGNTVGSWKFTGRGQVQRDGANDQ